MDLKKIGKVKSFDKRMELILEGIRNSDEASKDEAIDALISVAKYSSDWIEILALCVFFKSNRTDALIAKSISMIDHPMYVPDVYALLAINGNKKEANELVETHNSTLSYMHKVELAWRMTRFGEDKLGAQKIIEEVKKMEMDESSSERRNKYIANIEKSPPTPPTRSSRIRFFQPEIEAGFDWFGNLID